MNEEVISILSDIKIAIYLLLAVVILGVVANWIRAGVTLKDSIRRRLDDAFEDLAGDLYEKGQYEDLLSYCEDTLRKKPNHPYALWFKAKALYQKGELNEAQNIFRRLTEIAPNWEQSHIEPYMNKIERSSVENR